VSRFVDHVVGVVDSAGHSLPADCHTVQELVTWVDRVGESTLRDILEWQPKLAVVIQMPKRQRRAKR
jgi:hypothetical protein